MKFTKKLNKIDKEDVMTCGGKGASLGEMMNWGVRVPQGFVILVDSVKFDEKKINGILKKIDYEYLESVEKASIEIKDIILNAKFPDGFKAEVMEEFSKLGCEFVAVRSSATAEDGKNAAWAGQLESFLNTTKEKLMENIKLCFASLYSPRAIVYRKEKNEKRDVSVAVVVQRMVDSEKSGVGFSVHPVTEDKEQILIEAGFGLGEAVVSGQITPDNYVVREGEIVEKNVNVQKKALFRKGKGSEWEKIDYGDKQVLSGEEIIKVAEIIKEIEKHYGYAVDVEFGVSKGEIYILQCRPITTIR